MVNFRLRFQLQGCQQFCRTDTFCTVWNIWKFQFSDLRKFFLKMPPKVSFLRLSNEQCLHFRPTISYETGQLNLHYPAYFRSLNTTNLQFCLVWPKKGPKLKKKDFLKLYEILSQVTIFAVLESL